MQSMKAKLAFTAISEIVNLLIDGIKVALPCPSWWNGFRRSVPTHAI